MGINARRTFGSATGLGFAVLLAATLTLTSCTPGDDPGQAAPEPASTERAGESASPEPTEAPSAEEVIARYQVGEVLSAEDALVIQQNFDSGFNAYETRDGSRVLLERGGDIPAAVIDDIEARARESVGSAVTNIANGAGFEEAEAIREEATRSTGRRLLLVSQRVSFLAPAYEQLGAYWTYNSAMEGTGQWSTPGEAAAAAQRYIDAQSNPAQWLLIVSD